MPESVRGTESQQLWHMTGTTTDRTHARTGYINQTQFLPGHATNSHSERSVKGCCITVFVRIDWFATLLGPGVANGNVAAAAGKTLDSVDQWPKLVSGMSMYSS